MSLSGYSNYAANVAEELQNMLRAEIYEDLLCALRLDAEVFLIEWQRGNRELVLKIVTGQPAQRLKQIQKLPSDHQRFWAIAAAAKMAFETVAVLDAVELELQPMGAYREMSRGVQAVLDAPYLSEDCEWPFPCPKPST